MDHHSRHPDHPAGETHAVPHDPAALFPTDPTGLPEAIRPRTLELGDGDTTDLDVAPVAMQLEGTTVRMLAFNGSIPGPTLHVRQGTELDVQVTNHGDLDTTVHWHGLRLENRYDGVPVDTQPPIPVGGEFRYRLQFPDPGLYWYHPHIREDYTQELGLYGNILVSPTDPWYWPPVDSQLVLTIDDLLLENGRVAPFNRAETSHAAMGRYGNVFLVGGMVAPRLTVRAGEVIRLWLTNTANTRVFNLAVPGARMKLVGGDSGRVERQTWVTEVVVAPSERVVLDILFVAAGEHQLEHRTARGTHPLATLEVREPPAAPSAAAAAFPDLRDAPELVAERERLPLAHPPDKVLALVATIDDPAGAAHAGHAGHAGPGRHEPLTYRCPMHPEVTSPDPGRCPRCGMKLLAARGPVPAPTSPVPPDDHGGGHASAPGHPDATMPERDDLAGIEWEDDMVEVNRGLTSARVHWRVVDRSTGVDSDEIDWTFTVGDRVTIRLVNEAVSDHPMHHPFHVHGAGRFLILARNDVVETNLVWKDTVLVRAGETVDIVLHVSRPGRWMAHCHIAEHLQSGMMFGFTVTGELPETAD
jgi:FtsP/CotA-like multicopper oxidase with cupredoxin domain